MDPEHDPQDAGVDGELAALAPLADPVRRRLFLHVAQSGEAVGRDAAAAAVGVSRSLAAFHLDRLVADGLLTPEYRRLTGRTGPGAGRPAKLYRRSEREFSVELPERRYRLLAGWLADALREEHAGSAALRLLLGDAEERGRRLGAATRDAAGNGASVEQQLDAAVPVLASAGFAARRDPDGALRLANCPYDAVARVHRDLVCNEMNRCTFEAFAAALDDAHLQATLEPAEGRCCMVLRAVDRSEGPLPAEGAPA